jgi:hypothetical protein
MFRSSAGRTKTDRKLFQLTTFPLHLEIYGFLAVAHSFPLASESEISRWKEEKNENIVDSIRAPPKGLEPLTDWLTASRST